MPDDEERLQSELERLRGSLARARESRDARERGPEPSGPTSSGDSGLSMGLRAASEFVAAIIVGAAIGWGLDWLFATKPLFTIVFFVIGVAAGVWNVIRATSPKRGPKGGA
ncbi:MAG TPA: AtpZ/AtpI family protein [Roseiarcus sp.]|nr:AtpZ/AtpI family protein [Roseiarcus sp.]